MWASLLRWLLLLASSAFALRCVFSGTTPLRALGTVATGTLWFWLSRRKVLSLDRGRMGLSPRR